MKLQIQFALWLLRRKFPKISAPTKSVCQNTVMDGTDPCQLEEDALSQSTVEIADLVTDLQAAVELGEQRATALQECREQNNSEGGGPESP
jgi:hypothetical protein